MTANTMLSEHEKIIADILIKNGDLNKAVLLQALTTAETTGTPFLSTVVESGIVSKDRLWRAYAQHVGMTLYDTLEDAVTIDIKNLKKIPYSFVKKNTLMPLDSEGNLLTVAVADPLQLEALDDLRMMLGVPIKAVYCETATIRAAIEKYYRQDSGAASQLLADLRKDDNSIEELAFEDSYDLLDDVAQAPIVKLLNLIIGEAIHQGASDIHFEPSEEGLKVRYRIDGVLHNRHAPPADQQGQLLTRIKVMAKLDIAERRLPQDGRIKLRMGGRDIDFRVSTAPVINGERIVLRILHKGNVVLGIDSLGMNSADLALFTKIITIPEGIVLVTGPTGSGKTTTLYSVLCEIYSDETNIMTIEDPVEYKIPGISQIAVKPKIGVTFAAGLRHILRQDPDIIMVGEIRDKETAEIAIQASLTGHLVMSTLHTNDAPSAITRLVEMSIEPYLLSSTLAGVLAQRLLRCICPDCREAYSPTSQELNEIGLSLDEITDNVLFRGKGCASCYNSGYKGRHGIYELMIVDHHIKKQIVTSADASTMRALAIKQGMRTLRQHGAQLVMDGITTVTEVLRVTRGI